MDLCVKVTRGQLCSLVFVSLTQSKSTLEEGVSVKKLPPSDGPMDMAVESFSDY